VSSIRNICPQPSPGYFLLWVNTIAQVVAWGSYIVYDRGSGGYKTTTVVKWTLANHTVGSTLVGSIFYLCCPPKSDADSLFFRLMGAAILADLWICLVHRAFHKWGYQFHKRHHEYVEVDTVLAAFYAEPFDHLCINLLPILVPSWLVGLDRISTIMWVGLGVLSGINNHSGRTESGGRGMFPWPKPSYHDLHHRKGNVNFGVSALSDAVVDLLFK
jgi:sterol desaturase/sphingolipid hydroxylase (fatty acid hydroxylase superfamily)